MPNHNRTKKITLSYLPILLIVAIAFIVLSRPGMIGGGEHMLYGFFILFFLPIFVMLSCFFQARLRTRWMWLTPFIVLAIVIAIGHVQRISPRQFGLTFPSTDYWELLAFSLGPSLLGILLGLAVPRQGDSGPKSRALNVILSYVPVLLVFIVALILGQPSIITGGGEMVYGFFMLLFWPLSAAVTCFLQARLRTKWMWFAPLVVAALNIFLALPRTAFFDINFLGIATFSLVPALIGLVLGLVIPKKKET